MDAKELVRARLAELDRLAYERNILKCSGFLSYSEQQAFHLLEAGGCFMTQTHFLDGGFPDAERAAAFFLPDYMGREEAVAAEIAVIRACAVSDRYAGELTHRDYLGALMNLGIERDCIGDILPDGSSCTIFCTRELAGYIAENLLRVKHTSVRCEITEAAALDLKPRLEECRVNVASERVDAVIAALYKMSRQKAAGLVDAEQVFLNGLTVSAAGRQMKEGDRVSVRGFGKFIYDGIDGSSRKGRLFVTVRKYT